MPQKPIHKPNKKAKFSNFQGGGKTQIAVFAEHRTYAEWLHPGSLDDRANEILALAKK